VVRLDRLLGLLPADFRFLLVVLVEDLDRQTPIWRPKWSRASSKESRISLPITAVGPLKVPTNPIRTGVWALSGEAVSKSSTARPVVAVFI
jgi:hypothetical protein